MPPTSDILVGLEIEPRLYAVDVCPPLRRAGQAICENHKRGSASRSVEPRVPEDYPVQRVSLCEALFSTWIEREYTAC